MKSENLINELQSKGYVLRLTNRNTIHISPKPSSEILAKLKDLKPGLILILAIQSAVEIACQNPAGKIRNLVDEANRLEQKNGKSITMLVDEANIEAKNLVTAILDAVEPMQPP